jgi:hypothetical protein
MRVVYVAAHTRLHGGEVAEREDRIASAYVSICQLTSAHTRLHGGEVAEREDRIASAYVSMRQHTSAHVSLRQHTHACMVAR